ncbi:MAG: hypothetical protein JWN77_2812 [Frankiales bacterium]|jgi:hypothetical protein|nr:hypothetical protein [Frankiales bacterium]
MSRRLALTALPLLAVAMTVVPAHAAKPKVVKGSYDVTKPPNPTLEATGVAADGCDSSPIPTGTDDHAFKVPAAGTLAITLDSKDPSGAGRTDWDLYVLDAERNIINSSHGETSHEETIDKFKKAQPITIQVCNLAGAPDATVSYVFTYKS